MSVPSSFFQPSHKVEHFSLFILISYPCLLKSHATMRMCTLNSTFKQKHSIKVTHCQRFESLILKPLSSVSKFPLLVEFDWRAGCLLCIKHESKEICSVQQHRLSAPPHFVAGPDSAQVANLLPLSTTCRLFHYTINEE